MLRGDYGLMRSQIRNKSLIQKHATLGGLQKATSENLLPLHKFHTKMVAKRWDKAPSAQTPSSIRVMATKGYA